MYEDVESIEEACEDVESIEEVCEDVPRLSGGVVCLCWSCMTMLVLHNHAGAGDAECSDSAKSVSGRTGKVEKRLNLTTMNLMMPLMSMFLGHLRE